MGDRNQSGFGIVEILLGVVILGVLALIGYQVYQSSQNLAVAPVTSNTQPASVHEAIKNTPPIKTIDDLDKASQSLDNTQIDDSAAGDIDNEMNF